MDKRNNYHFGRHVFDYFPWYQYTNDLSSQPILKKEVWEEFKFCFDLFSPIINLWSGNIVRVDKPYGSILGIWDGIARYNDVTEEVFDWEDIEKIRLRILLGTKELADKYLKIIDFYQKYHELIADAIYLELEEDIEIPIVSIQDFVCRGNVEVCMGILSDEDVIEGLKNGNVQRNRFTDSVRDYLIKYNKLSQKQIDAVKKTSCFQLLTNKNIHVFVIKTNRIKNVNRFIDYLIHIGLKVKSFDGYVISYL